MTLAAIAKTLGVSTMTIYRRLRQNGLNIDEMRGADGQITTESASVIAALFDATQNTTQAQQAHTDSATGDATGVTNAVTEGQVSAMATEIAVLQAKLDAAGETIARLEGERDRLTAQLAAMTAALEREQTDRANERLLLTTGDQDRQQRRGLFSWLRRG